MRLENSYEDKIKEERLNEALKVAETQKTEDKQSDNLDDMLSDMFEEQTIAFGKADEKKQKVNKPTLRFGPLNQQDRDLASFLSLVPDKYRNATFSKEKIVNNIRKEWERSNHLYTTYDFEKYILLCTNILNSIRMGQLPCRSYIIGAPKGFGKASFVNECIMTLNKNCYRVTPYISLYELAEIRRIDSNNIMEPYSYREYYKQIANDRNSKEQIDKEYLTQYVKNGTKDNYHIEPNINRGSKTPDTVYGQYSYSEYINSACAFVALSGITSKEVESQELSQLLTIRGMKGLPTIVTVGTSLDPYVTDAKLREYVWDEILAYDEEDDLYDRVWHTSTYKRKYYSTLDTKGLKIDESTGIVSET